MKKSAYWLVCCLLLGSCSASVERLALLEANYLAARSSHAAAIEAYLEAVQSEDFSAYGEYGLATLYLGMGEYTAALEGFDHAGERISNKPEAAVHKELQYRIAYNRGIALFQESAFEAAAEAFRKALELDPARFEAKRNLELSLLSQNRTRTTSSGAASLDIRDDAGPSDTVFDYIREKEEERWKSREWTAEADAGLDY